MNIFILDDEINVYPRKQLTSVLARHMLTVATSYDDAIKRFKGPYDLLLLDHDMEGQYEYRQNYPNTGYQFVRWLVRQTSRYVQIRVPTPIPRVILHSHNSIGRRRMRDLLEYHGWPDVTEDSFSPVYLQHLQEQFG